jgi:D-alanine-D-alanine ligase
MSSRQRPEVARTSATRSPKSDQPASEEPAGPTGARRLAARSTSAHRHVEQAEARAPHLEAYDIAGPDPSFLPDIVVEPRARPRRLTRRITDLSAVEVVVLYSLALGLERGRPDDLLADQETELVAQQVAGALQDEVGAVHLAPVWDDVATAMRPFDPQRTVVFNLVESLGGRGFTEAEVPRLLRTMGFAHTGGSYQSLRRSGNKLVAKRLLESNGLQTPRYQVFHRRSDRSLQVPLPAIVKPVAEGGSFGVTQASVVQTEEQLQAQVELTLQTYHQPALVEEFIVGREINVALWGNGDPEVLPISEIVFEWTQDPLQKLVTFDAKWIEDSPEYKHTPGICPAHLAPEDQARIEQAAIRTFQLLGVKGFARVDIRLRDGIPYVLEANVNPDLNPEAGFFRSARAAGHTYASMVLTIVKMALASRS